MEQMRNGNTVDLLLGECIAPVCPACICDYANEVCELSGEGGEMRGRLKWFSFLHVDVEVFIVP